MELAGHHPCPGSANTTPGHHPGPQWVWGWRTGREEDLGGLPTSEVGSWGSGIRHFSPQAGAEATFSEGGEPGLP